MSHVLQYQGLRVFFFQAEDGIRDVAVTGVQTCALPIFHVVIFAALVTLDSSGRAQPFSGIMTAAFIFYMAIDAYRTAKARMLGQAPPSSALGGWSTDKPIGPIILITLGVIFLLDKYYSFWDWLGDYWSVALIVLGVLMLWKRMGRTS